MSALTLVMKELAGMDAEEFVNVRAYHSRGAKSFKEALQAGEATPSPTGSDSSGIGSVAGPSSEDEPASPWNAFSAALVKAAPTTPGTKAHKNKIVAKKDKQAPPKDKEEDAKIIYDGRNILNFERNLKVYQEIRDMRIMYEGRNILNLERNLLVHQWQLRSPLANTYSPFGGANQLSSFRFIEKSGGLEELTTICSECDFREPIQF